MQKTLKQLTCAAFAVGALASCNEYVDYIDNAKTSSEATYQEKLAEFASNFEKEFGKPDPNHTWGFGMTPEEADALLGGTTRALDPTDPYNQGGAINTNVNQWTEDNSNSLKNVIGVPGWPAEDGRFYTRNDANYISDGGNPGRWESDAAAKGKGNAQGDVTEYEIQWVSAHVRNNTYAELIDKHQAFLHMSEFFIQQVSSDYDYNEDGSIHGYGRNYQQYEMDKLDFQSITGAWTHINNFNAYANLAPQAHIGENKSRNIMYVMSAGTEDFAYHPSTSTADVFKKYVLLQFNWEEPLNPDWSKVKDGTYSLDYVLKNPAVLDPQGQTFQRTGYYLCFDYQASKEIEEGWSYEGDDVYSNWILKLTPGDYKQNNRWPKRLMCEDLGNTYDFDFNDAVFDLIFQPNVNDAGWYDCVIKIQAAGGTMPIWVGADPRTWDGSSATEIHKLLGAEDYTTPVNVIKGGKKGIPASYRVMKLFSTTEEHPTFTTDDKGHIVIDSYPVPNAKLLSQMAAAAFKLEIYIQDPKTGKFQAVSGEKIFKSLRNGDAPTYGQGFNDGNKSTNNAPQLFNCSTDAKWTYENTHINNAYEHFIDWVHDEQCEYRLRWDENEYYARMTGENTGQVTLVQHEETDKTNWLGSWDFGPKSSNVWGSGWINKSNCWEGNGPE